MVDYRGLLTLLKKSGLTWRQLKAAEELWLWVAACSAVLAWRLAARWKSGPSGPRNCHGINEGFSP
jgi:hypothetical protein